jgi:chromosome segregation ATPase
MNTVYLVTPLAMLAVFAGYVVPASTRLDTVLASRAAAEEQRRADERHEQEKQHQLAIAEQQRRTTARLREQAAKELAKREAQERNDQELSDRLDAARATREELRDEIAMLEAKLRHLASEQNRVDATLHAARAALETRLIARRNADLELQRMTLLLAESVEANLPACPPVFPRPKDR